MVLFYNVFTGVEMGNKCKIHIIHIIQVCFELFSLAIFRSALKVFSIIKIQLETPMYKHNFI